MTNVSVMEERAAAPLSLKDYRSDEKPMWCPGCGDFGVLSSTYKALQSLQLKPYEVVVVSGIGCSSRIPFFISSYGFHVVHGRALPVAQGVKLANPSLTVFAMGGDGDFFSIGPGHIPHAANRNMNITAVVMDNSTYGLTKGQTSPTSPLGQKTKSTPYGSIVQPLNPILMAIAQGATFVARAYSAKPAQLTDLLVRGIKHKGFAFIQVESPCTEFNNTFSYFDGVVEDLPADWDPSDARAAMEMALTEEKVHVGLFYQGERPVYEDQFSRLAGEHRPFDIEGYLRQYQ